MNSLTIAKLLIKRSFRNKKEFLAMIILPIIVVGLMTFLINKQANEPLELLIANLDNGTYGEKLVESIERKANVDLQYLQLTDYKEIINNETSKNIVVIPKNFSKDLLNNTNVHIAYYDHVKTPFSSVLNPIINQFISTVYSFNDAAEEVAHKTTVSKESILHSMVENYGGENITTRVHNIKGNIDDNEQALLSSIGFVIIFIMIFIFTTIGTIMEDKKRLTLAKMYVAPIREWEIILGNLIGSFAIGLLQLIPLMLTLIFIFQLPWGLSLVEIFLVLTTFLLATIGIGIGVSGMISNTSFNQSIIISTVIVPTSILGGAFIPSSLLPDILNKVGYLVPQKYVMLAFEKIFAGNNIQGLLMDLGIILLFGLAFSTFGLKTLKPLDE